MRSFIALYAPLALVLTQSSNAAPPSIASSPQPVASTGGPVESAISAAASDYVGYVSDPNGRGTASLVISCLLTLILCVWSALHLNVPQQGETAFQSLLVSARWIVAGVYAPELVVFTAWRQWSSAKLLGSLIKETRKKQAMTVQDIDDTNRHKRGQASSESRSVSGIEIFEFPLEPDSLPIPSHPVYSTSAEGRALTDLPSLPRPQEESCPAQPQVKKKSGSFGDTNAPGILPESYRLREDTPLASNHWTMTHSFFASTGGFVFEIRLQDIPESYIGPIRRFLPPGSPQRLSLTARGVALLARCGHLPDVTKAEITDKSKANDLAKALVMVQASWMLVQVIGRLITKLPVTLLEVNTIAHVLCAILMYAMWWHKPLSPKEPFVLSGDWVNPLCAYMYMSSEMSGAVDPNAIESQTLVKTLFAFFRLYSKVPELESMSYRVTTKSLDPASDRCLCESESRKLEKAAGTAFFERRPRVKGVDLNSAATTQRSSSRWALAAEAIEMYPALRKHYLFHSHDQDQCLHFKSEELLVPRVQNWPWDDLLRNVGGLVVGMILWLACFLYGAVHMAAWNEHFPSAAEKWLWRSSSAYIGFCGGLWIILNYGAQAYKPFNAFWERWMDGGGRWWQNVLISVPVVICGLSLILARAFIVIEAFVSIRELPAGAYDTPSWTQVFPHF